MRIAIILTIRFVIAAPTAMFTGLPALATDTTATGAISSALKYLHPVRRAALLCTPIMGRDELWLNYRPHIVPPRSIRILRTTKYWSIAMGM